jgi:hypothetical protein
MHQVHTIGRHTFYRKIMKQTQLQYQFFCTLEMLFSIKGPFKNWGMLWRYSEDVSDSSSPQFNLIAPFCRPPGARVWTWSPQKQTLWLNKIAERTQAHQLTWKLTFNNLSQKRPKTQLTHHAIDNFFWKSLKYFI